MFKKISKNFSLIVGALLVLIALYFTVVPNIIVAEERECGDFVEVTDYTATQKEAIGTPLGFVQEYRMTFDKFEGESTPHLIFYARHQYVRVFIGDKAVYTLLPHHAQIGETVGLNWVMIHLQNSDIGKEILVEITPVYESHAYREPEFLLGSELGVYSNQLREDMPQIVLSCVCILLGCIFIAFGIERSIRKKAQQELISLGLFSLIMGLWRFTDIRFVAFLFPERPVLLAYLSIATLMMCIVPLCFYTTRTHKNRFVAYGYAVATSLVCLGQIVLQLAGVRDFRQTLTWSHVMIIVGIISIFISAILNRKQLKEESKFDKLMPLVFIMGVIVDVVVYFVVGSSSDLLFTVLPIVLFVLISGAHTVHNYLRQEKLLAQKEVELTEARVAITLSQIQPHFLYNALNSIAELCREDPEKARTATVDFAEYLRVNLKSIQKKTVVPFDEELAHVRRYLDLEKMRFDERLNIVYDIRATEFLLPQLSVQPLIENAVKHGVGEKEEGGTVTIATREQEDCFLVTITDDGIGFDVKEIEKDGKVHIGLENSRNRLKSLCNSTVEIQSKKGVGTRATIRIPKGETK